MLVGQGVAVGSGVGKTWGVAVGAGVTVGRVGAGVAVNWGVVVGAGVTGVTVGAGVSVGAAATMVCARWSIRRFNSSSEGPQLTPTRDSIAAPAKVNRIRVWSISPTK